MVKPAQDYSHEGGNRGGGVRRDDYAHHQQQQQQQQQYYSDDDGPLSNALGRGQGLMLGPVKVKGKLAPGQGLVKGVGGAKGAVRRSKQGQGLAPGRDPTTDNNQHNHNNNHNNNRHNYNNNHNDGHPSGQDFSAQGPGLGQIDPLAGYAAGEEALAQTPSGGGSVPSSTSTAVRRPVPHYR